MKSIRILIFIFSLFFCVSCKDINNVTVSGQVLDQVTNKPISNAEVVVLCWYTTSIDDVSFAKKTVFTDSKGMYRVQFDKGHNIDVASQSKGYNPARSYVELSSNEIVANLKLSTSKENSTLRSWLNTDNLIEGEMPFLGLRIYADVITKKLDLNRVETIGFDLINFKSTTDTSTADFWFMIEKKQGQPSVICASKDGGILPIKDEETTTSLLYTHITAPDSVYFSSYELKSDEHAFFVLCRDGKTYGKIILERTLIDKSIPDGKGSYFMEYGRQFSCLYQSDGTRNLAYSIPDMDLENYLLHR